MSLDENVLHATLQTLKIFENSTYFKPKAVFSFSLKDEIESDLELLNASLVRDYKDFSDQETTDFQKDALDNRKFNCIEVRTTVESIMLVHEMYKYYLQETKKFQEKGDISCIQGYSADVMDTAIVSQKIDLLQFAWSHIKTIVEERNKLKQVLRNNVLNDVWKINKDYHKAVINFFKLASKLVNCIEMFIHPLETSEKYNQEYLAVLKNKEIKILAEINETMDVLTDFQNYVNIYKQIN